MAHKPDAKSLGLNNYRYPDRFGDWLGYQVELIDREKRCAVLELEIREDHLSAARKVHGGVISAFLDFSCGAAVFSTMDPDDFCSTVELKVNYFYPILLHDKLTAKTEVVFRGKKLCVVHGRLYRNGNEQEVLAMATATFNVVAPKAQQPKS